MALDFPNSPTVGQIFSAAGRQWIWNGTTWDSAGTQLAATSPITYANGSFAFDSVAFAKQENYELFYVKNASGASIAKGSAVYISGSNGDNALISKAQANAESTSSKTLGLVYETIANDAFGYVVTSGKLTGLDTSTATAGDPVWLSPSTAGGIVFGLANKPSAPNHLVYLGIVTRAHAQTGEIEVLVQNGYELDELHDVSITSPATGDIIQRNSSGLWVNKTIEGAGIATTNAPTLISPTVSLPVSNTHTFTESGIFNFAGSGKIVIDSSPSSVPSFAAIGVTFTLTGTTFGGKNIDGIQFTISNIVNYGYASQVTGTVVNAGDTTAVNTYTAQNPYGLTSIVMSSSSTKTISPTEISYLDGVTSNIQTQINGLESTSPFLLMGA